MAPLVLFFILNAVIILCCILSFGSYRKLSQIIPDSELSKDPMSVKFLDRIFVPRPDNKAILPHQRRVVAYACTAFLLVYISSNFDAFFAATIP